MGLLPGPQNFVQQAYDRELIPKPVISFIPSANVFAQNVIVLGDYDNVSCIDWTFYPTINKSWTIKVENIRVNGQDYGSSLIVSLYLFIVVIII